MLRRFLPILLLVLAVTLPVGGVIALGRLALDDLRAHGEFCVRFADISCNVPPGQTREDFLDEVRYLSRIAAELPLLDDDLPRRLEAAFAMHPWVEKVDRVDVRRRSVEVCLTFRRPVLAVPWRGELRAVDRHGVLLPAGAATAGLPVFDGDPGAPQGAAGTPWGNPAVTAAARQAADGKAVER